MALWAQFGQEEPEKTQERILLALQFQDEQLQRIVKPITSDIQNRIVEQEKALRKVYRPLVTSIKRDITKQRKMLDRVNQELETLHVQEEIGKVADRLPLSASELEQIKASYDPRIPGTPLTPTIPSPYNPAIAKPLPPVSLGPLYAPLPSLPDSGEFTPSYPQPSIPAQQMPDYESWYQNLPKPFPPGTVPAPPPPVTIPTLPTSPPTSPPIPPITIPPPPPPPIGTIVCPPPQVYCNPVVNVTPNVVTNPVINVSPVVDCKPEITVKPEINVTVSPPEDKGELEEDEGTLTGYGASILPAMPCPFDVGTVASNQFVKANIGTTNKFADEVAPFALSQGPAEASTLLCNPWEPDTERICFLIDAYIQRFTEIGNAAVQFIHDTVKSGSTIAGSQANLTNIILKALLPIAQVINPAQFVDTIAGVVRNLTVSITSGMIVQGSAYVGLSIIKLILETLESVVLGWNLGPAVMIQLKITLTKEKEVLEYLRNYLWPTSIPSSPDVSTMLVAGLISEPHAECLWRMNSSLPRLERKIAYARRPQVGADTLVRLWQREPYNVNDLYKRIAQQGWQNPDEIGELISSQLFIPTPSDSISMAVRDVFDPGLLGKDLMTAEYAQQQGLSELFRANGIGNVKIGGISPQTGDIVDVGLLYWLSHYVHCSPTQVYEMFHRLRPGRVEKWALPGQTQEQINAMVTTLDHVTRLLKLNDYNPFWRDRLAAIAYRTIGRIDLRRLYNLGIFGKPLGRKGFTNDNGTWVATGPAEKEIVAANLDVGYSPTDSANLAAWTAIDYDNKQLAGLRKELSRQVCEAIEIGYQSPEEGSTQLQNAGIDESQAEMLVQKCDLTRRTKQLKRAISYVRRAVLGGRLQNDGAESILNQLGLKPQAIQDYLNEWDLDVRMRAKEPLAEKLCQWFGAGLLSFNEFRDRLVRLGYSQVDWKRVVAHCMIGIQGKLAREQEKIAKLLDKNKKEREARERKRLREFLSARTEKNLKEWCKDGTISLDDIRLTLKLKGWNQADINRFTHNLNCGASNGSSKDDDNNGGEIPPGEIQGTRPRVS